MGYNSVLLVKASILLVKNGYAASLLSTNINCSLTLSKKLAFETCPPVCPAIFALSIAAVRARIVAADPPDIKADVTRPAPNNQPTGVPTARAAPGKAYFQLPSADEYSPKTL